MEGFGTVHRLTQAQVDAGEANSLSGVRIEIVDANGQKTGVVMESGAAGATPSVVATQETVQTAVSGSLKKVSLTGTGSKALTHATHNGAEIHAEAGITECTMALTDFQTAGQQQLGSFWLFNFSAAELPLKLGTGWSGGISMDGETANDLTGAGTLISIPHATSVHVVYDADKWVRADLLGIQVTQAELDTKASLASPAFTGTPTGITKTHVGLGNVDNTADAAKPVSTAQQTALAAKQATLVSGTNIKTVNGASIVGSGNVAVAADLPGGTAQTAYDEGYNPGNATIDRTTVPGQTILRYETTGVSTFVAPTGVTSVQTLVVGGGGGGGYAADTGRAAGGGGAGGVRTDVALAVGTGSYAITVGPGGGGGTSAAAQGGGGSPSSIGALLSVLGGGGGGGSNDSANSIAGTAGGSGGGGKAGNPGGVGGAGTSGEGFAGGGSVINSNAAGGGGGASAVGGNASGTAAGNGGVGVASTITGASVTYGGGGGGGALSPNNTAGTGGGGGGGAGSATTGGSSGTANTGGGGGGASSATAGTHLGGAGGSGVVIIRFATQTRSYQALQTYADNAAAITGGRRVGEFYRRTSDGALQQVQ